MIHVHEGGTGDGVERHAPVLRAREARAARVHHFGVVRVHAYEAVVHGAVVVVAPEGPRAAPVRRAPEPRLLGIRVHLPRLRAVRRHFDERVDHVRVGARDVEPDAPHGALGESVALQAGPAVAPVVGPPDTTPRTAAVEAPPGSTALVGGREEHVGVLGMHDQIRGARVLVHEQNVLPGAAAVRGAEDAALAIRLEEVPHRGHVDDVGVRRVENHPVDALRLPKPHMGEGLPAVGGPIYAVAEGRALAVVRLTGPYPNQLGIRLGHGHRSDGRRPVAVEHRVEGRARVDGLPQPTRGESHVEDPGVAFHHGDLVHAPAHGDGADLPPAEAAKERIGRRIHRRKLRGPGATARPGRSHHGGLPLRRAGGREERRGEDQDPDRQEGARRERHAWTSVGTCELGHRPNVSMAWPVRGP